MKDHTYQVNDENVGDLNAELRSAVRTFHGKWKLEILWTLSHRMHRFNELKRALPGITQHTLALQLRELEQDGMVTRTVHPEIPPRVEYVITAKARGLRPVFSAIFEWARGENGDGKPQC